MKEKFWGQSLMPSKVHSKEVVPKIEKTIFLSEKSQ